MRPALLTVAIQSKQSVYIGPFGALTNPGSTSENALRYLNGLRNPFPCSMMNLDSRKFAVAAWRGGEERPTKKRGPTAAGGGNRTSPLKSISHATY